ncbi:YggT family protein [Candidatus Hoaglandella endobia]|uniref:YGGT family protein n=1 Tax=Candidatus Hoaglandella endobia TaxID=1778263 RepID=A0A143WU73_9ENTR|nr:YggT family protein [Candidatus Hoaglandella endobia]CUX97142.1 YGGT family protein [Candidatus Hoaglandella endobia]
MTLTFLIKTLIDLYIMVLLLRIWMQYVSCDFYHPFSQYIVKITQFIIIPLRRRIPYLGPLDNNSLLLIIILAIIKFPLLMLIEIRVLILDPIYLLVGLLSLLKVAGKLVFLVIFIHLLLSLISQGRSQMNRLLYKLSEPLTQPIRRILPDMNGIDYSSIIIILILYALNYLSMDFFLGIWYDL